MNAKLTSLLTCLLNHTNARAKYLVCQELKKHQYNSNILIIEVYSNSIKSE